MSTSSQLVQVRKGVRDGIPLEAHHSDFHIGERSATQSISVPIEGHILKPNPPHKREKMSDLFGKSCGDKESVQSRSPTLRIPLDGFHTTKNLLALASILVV